jgi:TolB-like protein/Flp pilus assembly protein TadD
VLGRGEEELGIDEEQLWCDVRHLETALEAGQAEPALELYRGELLSGLHVSDAPEFERWLDEEREHLRRCVCGALETLATDAAAGGERRSAAEWWRRLSALDPLNSRITLRLMDALAASGDRAAALQVARAHKNLLREELGAEPEASVAELAESLRTESNGRGPARPERLTVHDSSDPASIPVQPDGSRGPDVRRARIATKRVAAMVALIGGGLIVGGWLVFGGEFAARSAGTAPTTKRLVVLPFVNLGSGDDAYFAAGVTEELTARLAVVDRLRVIGSTSASRYKNTTKSIPEIGKELGVDYVLEGSVRWQKSAGGPARVRVTPQLVSTRDGAHLWAQIYDEPLDEIFRVQSDIAQKVVHALNVTLVDQQRRTVEAAPTTNLEAYDYYLRGHDYVRRGTDETTALAAARMFEKAVELDPGFALAYAHLARAYTRLYWSYSDHSEERLTKAKQAIDKALELEPGMPEAHHSLGTYYGLGLMNYDRALREFAIAESSRPNDSRLFLARANVETRQGRFQESLADFEKAWQLDPASSNVASNYGITFDILRDYPRAEALYTRAIALAPDRTNPYMLKIWLYLRWDGKTQRARAVLEEARAAGLATEPKIFYPQVMMEIYDRKYQEAINLLSSEAREVINSDQTRVVPRAQLYAQVYGLMGRHDLARAYSDSARILLSRKVQEAPDDPRLRTALGIAYAGLGRKQEAIREGLKAVELVPINKEVFKGYHHAWELTRIYIAVGEYDIAIGRLEYLLSVPGQLTAAWLRMDPGFDPLRSHPRFQRLVGRSK